MPGLHRRACIGPYGEREERWHIWKSNSDNTSYTLRYELEWKDQVYVDATYEGKGEGRWLVVDCVNRTDLPQNLDLHLVSSLTRNPLRSNRVDCPGSGVWTHAIDYQSISFQSEPHRIGQSMDAMKAGEWLQPDAVNGCGVGARNFFHQPGDAVSYLVSPPAPMQDAKLLLRYHRWNSTPCLIRLTAGEKECEVELLEEGTPMTQVEVDIGNLSADTVPVRIELVSGGECILEGFALIPSKDVKEFRIVPPEGNSVPESRFRENVLELSYTGIPHGYEVEVPEGLHVRVGAIDGDDVPAILADNSNDSVHCHWTGLGSRRSVLLMCGPVALMAGERKQFRFRIGLKGRTPESVPAFSGFFPVNTPYAFGMERLAATVLSNQAFPLRHKEGYVRHNSPGRQWDSLYTWDSGMVGLGLSTLDVERAKDSLNQYLLPAEDPDAAFVEHGTPLPIQAEQAMEIWKRTGDRDWLAQQLPKLRNFYEWLAGRTRGSTTDRFETGLLQTWDYNYNSGGWDDYPPQWELRTQPELRRQISPCVTTSYAIRFARHMIRWSEDLNQDASVFRNDLTRWQAALEHAWDEEAGHYSYVMHDEQGRKTGFYRHASGVNYNRGFDGVIPLVAGGLTPDRTRQLMEFFFDPEELWTPWGGTTVAQSAPYYSDAGYWNGAIWMPHNVMIWRALRELGERDKARKLAVTLLDTWERETRASYHSFELFRADTGRGSGWHQFSALSSPLLMMYEEEFL